MNRHFLWLKRNSNLPISFFPVSVYSSSMLAVAQTKQTNKNLESSLPSFIFSAHLIH